MTGEHPDALLYKRLRLETIGLLGLDAASLSTAQSVKVDLVSSLRLALDTFTAAQLRGEHVDTGKLLSAAEALERLLPRSASPFNAKAHLDSVRAKFTALIDSYANEYDRAQDVEIAALKAEVAQLQTRLSEKAAVISALGGQVAAASPTPPAPPSPPPTPPQQQTSPQPPLHASSAPYLRRGDGVVEGGRFGSWDRWSNRG